jgi:glycosyltransferase involved in cell wall biosynthesis
MKLVIQIPCFNEADFITKTIYDLPKQIDGIDEIEVLVIDDGSSDNTVEVAKNCGIKNILRLSMHRGLAFAFAEGLRHSVYDLHADIVVNTDADNQYHAKFICELIKPIINSQSDIVIGCRPIDKITHFSKTKKILQNLGSRTVQLMTGVQIPDVTSGFRAYSRLAGRRLKVFSDFSYTIETLIQASKTGLRIMTVPIEVNPPTRPSRLFSNNLKYIAKQLKTMIRIWILYSPVKLFTWSGSISLATGLLLIFRFLYFYIISWPNPSGKVQSLIFASVLLLFGIFQILVGILADLIAVNRRLIEETHDRLDKLSHNSEE